MSAAFFEGVADALAAVSVEEKKRLVAALPELAEPEAGLCAVDEIVAPGYPAGLSFVQPGEVRRRAVGSQGGRAAMLHAIAHIEFTAINLALEHVFRFRGLPMPFYQDWLRVAEEEIDHFQQVEGRLHALGCRYGELPAHGGLWAMAEKTRESLAARMALVPRFFEARGLDATPPIIRRFESAGDEATVAALQVILRDEVGHVALGDRWFRDACRREGKAAEPAYRELLSVHGLRPKAPLNLDARRAAGFSDAELADLVAWATA